MRNRRAIGVLLDLLILGAGLLKLRQQVQHLCPDREGLLRWEDDTGT